MTAGEPVRKTRAIVFSDIQGYSRIMSEDENLALRLLEEHNAICVPLIKQGGGTVLKFIGDAILSAFESAADAVQCGIATQRALALRNAGLPERERVIVRVGIHIGDVVLKDGDVFGDGVNIAARIEPLAEAGGIAISQTVYDMVRARPEIQTVSLGPKELKNINETINTYKVLVQTHETARPDSTRLAGLRVARTPAALLIAGLLFVGFVASRLAAKRRQASPPPPSGLVGRKADGSVDQAFVDCYERHGGPAQLGVPFDNGGGVFAHNWGDDGMAQDYNGGPAGPSMCLRKAAEGRAWLLRGSIREEYMRSGGPGGPLGLPVSDEVNGVQQFERGELTTAAPGRQEPPTPSRGLIGRNADGSVDQAVVDCYVRHGGKTRLGTPFDNGGGILVHNWEDAGVAQDYNGGPAGPSMCLRKAAEGRAWLLRGSIREDYLRSGGPDGPLGLPISEETNGVQRFERGELTAAAAQ